MLFSRPGLRIQHACRQARPRESRHQPSAASAHAGQAQREQHRHPPPRRRSGSRSATSICHHASLPCCATIWVTCSIVSSVSSGSPARVGAREIHKSLLAMRCQNMRNGPAEPLAARYGQKDAAAISAPRAKRSTTRRSRKRPTPPNPQPRTRVGVVEDGDGHTPLALARDAPVGAALGHGGDAVLAAARDPVHAANGLQRRAAEALHRRKPLQNERRVVVSRKTGHAEHKQVSRKTGHVEHKHELHLQRRQAQSTARNLAPKQPAAPGRLRGRWWASWCASRTGTCARTAPP